MIRQNQFKAHSVYILVLMVGVLSTLGCSERQKPKDTLVTPEAVLQETISVLEMIAKQMNTGKKELKYLHELDQAKTKLIK